MGSLISKDINQMNHGKFDIQTYKPDASCQGSLISKNINQMHHAREV